VFTYECNWLTGLKGIQKRWLPYNGAISLTQLKWLEKQLQESKESKEKVLIFSHVPIYLPASHAETIMWNYEIILETIHKYENIIAWIAGHDHDGGYAIDEKRIIHITLPSPLETTIEEHVAFGYIQIYKNRLILKGYGSLIDKDVSLT